MNRDFPEPIQKCWRWLASAEHRAKAQALGDDLNRAFTEHPRSAGETYWQHLWFTTTMSMRFFYATTVIFIHGLFPFLMTRTASNQTEAIYRIMKTRIPKERRDAIDADIDYYV